MVRINYLQELRRLEKKMDDAFDHFAMIIQKQFTDLIKASEENRVNVENLRIETDNTKSIVEELRLQTAELKASNLKHDVTILELKATTEELREMNRKHDISLSELKDITREVKELSKNNQNRIVVLEEALA